MTDVRRPTDDQIISYLVKSQGARTHYVADAMGPFGGLPYEKRRDWIYRALLRLEAMGRVQRNGRYTYDNSVYWEVPGHELK